MKRTLWRVYGSAPPPVAVRSRRAALRLANRYARLGILSDYYRSDDGSEWVRWPADAGAPAAALVKLPVTEDYREGSTP